MERTLDLRVAIDVKDRLSVVAIRKDAVNVVFRNSRHAAHVVGTVSQGVRKCDARRLNDEPPRVHFCNRH